MEVLMEVPMEVWKCGSASVREGGMALMGFCRSMSDFVSWPFFFMKCIPLLYHRKMIFPLVPAASLPVVPD